MVGVLWDVITFWPRANHPLTPRCYGERTVPELVGQLSYLTLGSTRRLVLAAHSQGSIIAAANILQADNAGLPQTALETSYKCTPKYPDHVGAPGGCPRNSPRATVATRWYWVGH